jgi:hypothetical protein
MHPTVLLFVLLFVPSSSLRDWQTAPAPHLHQLMQSGALGLMNVRTAEQDTITDEAGQRTILAGARVFGSDSAGIPDYPTLTDNLETSLIDSNVSVNNLPQLDLPFYSPPSIAQFNVATLNGSWVQIDAQVANYAGIVGQKKGILMIVSPSPTQAEYVSLHQLTPVLMWGQGIPSGLLVSPTTRESGLVANTDIAPTISELLAAPLQGPAYGAEIGVIPSADDHATVLAQRENTWIAQAQAIRMLPFLSGAIALMVLLAIYFNGRTHTLSTKIASFAAIIPLTVLLSSNFVIFAGFIGLAIVAVAFVLKPGDTVFFTAATIGIMVSVDAFAFGGHLTGQSILGYSPLEGARYYGVGNEVLGAYAGSLAVITGIWDWQGRNRPQLIVMWLLAGLAMALPTAGAKAGGLIVCLVTLSAYVLVGVGKRLTDMVTLLSLVAALAVSIVVLYVVNRIGPQTHISNAFAMANSGGASAIFPTLLRKAEMDVHLIFHSVWIWVLLATSFGRWRLHRSDILAAVGTAATISCLIFNDAGVVAAAICSLIVWAAEVNRTERKVLSSTNVPAQQGLV